MVIPTCVYVHQHLYILAHPLTYVYMYIYTHTHAYTYMQVRFDDEEGLAKALAGQVCMYVHLLSPINVHVYICRHEYIHAYVRMYIVTHIHTYIGCGS